MSVFSSVLSIRHIFPFHRAYRACFTVFSPFSTSKKSSTAGDDLNKLDQDKDKDKEKVKAYVVSQEDLTILSTYKEIVGDLHISTRFKVPKKDPWPTAFHGYALGKVVSIINHHKDFNTLSVKSLAKLKNLGFRQKPQKLTEIAGQQTFKLHTHRSTSNFEHVKEALLTYKSIYGDMLVPSKYIVSEDDPRYATHFHGMKLGNVVNSIRNNNSYSKHREELMAMGFQYENINRPPNFEHVKEALLTYKSIYGDMLVPSEYIVPKDDPHYSSHLHGMKLGTVVNSIRLEKSYSKHREELVAMGFRYENIHRPPNFEHVKEALLTYNSIFGDLLVPNKYTVPEDDPRYASHLHGMQLGNVVMSIRNRDTYSNHKAELLAMGFRYENINRPPNFDHAKEALLTYKRNFGDMLVPSEYIVPKNDPRYASHLHGMQLGNVVMKIRNDDAYSNHKAELLAMGFQYENIHRPPNFEHVKEALLTYKSIYGDLLVLQRYIVRENDPRYASHLHGMKLGAVLRDIRHKNTYSKYREELLAMGFRYERYGGLF